MSNLKNSIFDKLYNVCVSQIEVVTPNDLSKKKISLVVEEALRFLKQPKDYEFKYKLILQLLENFTVKSSSHAIIKGKSDHIDWYDSTKICLDFLYDKVVDGGMMARGAWDTGDQG